MMHLYHCLLYPAVKIHVYHLFPPFIIFFTFLLYHFFSQRPWSICHSLSASSTFPLVLPTISLHIFSSFPCQLFNFPLLSLYIMYWNLTFLRLFLLYFLLHIFFRSYFLSLFLPPPALTFYSLLLQHLPHFQVHHAPHLLQCLSSALFFILL